ncbi:MAG: hypothetical protein DRI73_04435 [Bacteroidetes bacterium]|nr:MAG: hypothetical protein DRI73_04435 [Bacteroidota bacterium]
MKQKKSKQALYKLVLLIVIYISSLSTFAGDLEIGASSVKITPPLGIPMAGYYHDRGAEKIHDDLYAKAIVIENDGVKVAIVSCDIIKVTSGIVAEVRNLVQKSIGINPDYVMIGATHSHTGPVISDKNNKDKMRGKSSKIQDEYLSKLPGLIAESIIKANSALMPAKISLGLGQEESISFNRRFFMTDGTVGWNPGKMNPNIIKPAGPIDPDVFVLYSETTDGNPISTYVNFALHLDNVSKNEISADLPYTLSTILGKIKGEEMVTLFSQACSGNINHINVKSPEKQTGHINAQRLGSVLSGEVIKTYTRLQTLDINKISVKKEIVKLPLPEISPDEIDDARITAATYGTSEVAPFMELVKSIKILDVYERKGNPIDAEIQVFALGDKCAIVSLPGEIFTELGIYIKNRSPYPYTIITELTNNCIGYIPDRKAYIEGNYEPVSSRCAPGSGEILAEHALKMLNELKME